MILLLIRHGESEFNAQGRIQGQLEVPLTETGRKQAAALAERLAGERLNAIYASPLSRALETAQTVATRIGLEVRVDARLKEINAGVFQGLTREEMMERYPDEELRWTAREPDFRVTGGETRRELMERGCTVLQTIRETGLERVAVVSHGAFLAAALKGLLGIPVERGPFHFYNCAISRILWKHEIMVDTLNDTEHLRELRRGGWGDL